MIALADCNNFFASCERSIRPELEGKPLLYYLIMMAVLLPVVMNQRLWVIKWESLFLKSKTNYFETGFICFQETWHYIAIYQKKLCMY